MFQFQNKSVEESSPAEPRRRSVRPRQDAVLQEELVLEIGDDRRSRRRYDLGLDLHYKLIEHYRVARAGNGKTVDLSSSGILFSTVDSLKPGSFVELSIHWPVLLNQSCPLKLVVNGRVIRSESGLTAMRLDRYEFRTLGTGALPAANRTFGTDIST
jgi:hypothetical protein